MVFDCLGWLKFPLKRYQNNWLEPSSQPQHSVYTGFWTFRRFPLRVSSNKFHTGIWTFAQKNHKQKSPFFIEIPPQTVCLSWNFNRSNFSCGMKCTATFAELFSKPKTICINEIHHILIQVINQSETHAIRCKFQNNFSLSFMREKKQTIFYLFIVWDNYYKPPKKFDTKSFIRLIT